MPKKYVDDLTKIYNEDIVFPTKPGPGAQELEQHGKEGVTGKVFDDGGPANADGFHEPELDPKKKKKDDESSYEEEKYSSAVKEESINEYTAIGAIGSRLATKASDAVGDARLTYSKRKGELEAEKEMAKQKHLQKLKNEAAPRRKAKQPLGKKVAKGATKATGAAVGGASGVHSGRAVGKVLGKLAGSSKAGEIAGGVLGGAAGALAGKKAADYVVDEKNSENLQENDQEEINNFTMSDKSTFDKLFEDVMGEADFELPADADMDMDLGGEEEAGGDDVKAKLAEVIEALQELHDSLDGDAGEGEGEGDDIEDLEDANNPFEEEVEHDDHGHALVNAKSGQSGNKNVVDGATPVGHGKAGDASATGADDGAPKAAPDGTKALTKGKTAGSGTIASAGANAV